MDPIADMLIRIKNAQAVGQVTVDIPYSNLKYKLANILLENELLKKVEKKHTKTKRVIRVTLKYKDKKPIMEGLVRVSKPGRRVYVPAVKIRLPKGGQGIMILSTSKGLMTGREARKKRLGGEVICEIW